MYGWKIFKKLKQAMNIYINNKSINTYTRMIYARFRIVVITKDWEKGKGYASDANIQQQCFHANMAKCYHLPSLGPGNKNSHHFDLWIWFEIFHNELF